MILLMANTTVDEHGIPEIDRDSSDFVLSVRTLVDGIQIEVP